jgi:hypothetical protein
MFSCPKAAVERAMQVQAVILRTMARKITWWQAAEILGISDRQMRRVWRFRLSEVAAAIASRQNFGFASRERASMVRPQAISRRAGN